MRDRIDAPTIMELIPVDKNCPAHLYGETMPAIKRPNEDQNSEEGSLSKRRTVIEGNASSESDRSGSLGGLPGELWLDIADDVTPLPDRQDARSRLVSLISSSKQLNKLILGSEKLKETRLALQQHPGVKSRHLAVCLDVVDGVSVEKAFRQNGPLPRADENLQVEDLRNALGTATPEHLAILAQAFGALDDPSAKKVLTGVAGVIDRERLETATVADLATLARAFTTNDLEIGKHAAADALEEISLRAFERRFEVFDRGNMSEMVALAAVHLKHPEDEHAEMFVEVLAFHVNGTGRASLQQATGEQLATLKALFEDFADDDDCQSALVHVQEVAARVELATTQRDRERPLGR